MQIQTTLDGKIADETRIREFELGAYMKKLDESDNSHKYDFNWKDEEDFLKDIANVYGVEGKTGTILIMD